MEKQNCCAVFGQHPICFKWGFDEEDDGCRKMKLELLQQIMALRQHGVTRFLVACDFGVELYAADLNINPHTLKISGLSEIFKE